MWCRKFISALIVLSTLAPLSAKPHEGVDYVKTGVDGVPIHLVDVDIKRDDLVVKPVVVPSGQRESFQKMVKDSRPVVAVNGTFFDTLTGITVGNLVADGRLLSEGMTGSNLIYNKDGSWQLLSSSRNLGRYKDWSDVKFAVGGGPTLLASGEFFMDPASEGFRDPSLFTPRPRAAIGVTENGHMRVVVVTQGITLWKLAHIMKDLHCVNAINLDGGTSTGLSVGGTTMVRPGRKLTNIVGVFASHMEPALSRATRVAETRAMAHYRKSQSLLNEGKLRLARSQARQAVAKAPEQAGFWRSAGQIELQAGNSDQGLKDLLKSASIYFERGDLHSAMSVADEMVANDANSIPAHLVLGECHAELLEDVEAEHHLQLVLDNFPGHPRATELLRDVHYRLNSQRKLEASGSAIVDTLSLL